MPSKIESVEVMIGGVPNQLFSKGMYAYQIWDEARKLFAAGSKRHPDVAMVAKDLGFADFSQGEYLTTKYALWLDLRTSDDDRLHGRSGLIAGGDATFPITKRADAAGALNIHVYVIMDAQLNIEDDRYVSALY